jgi:hypothetical protein
MSEITSWDELLAAGCSKESLATSLELLARTADTWGVYWWPLDVAEWDEMLRDVGGEG